MTRSGKMDQRIAVERLTVTTDGQGSVIEVWKPHADLWAEVRELRATQAVDSAQRVASEETIFSVRADSITRELATTDRIRWSGRVYDIIGKTGIPSGRPERLELLTRGGQS